MRAGTVATMAAAILLPGALSACSHRQTGAEMLTQCWNAQPTGQNGEYVVHIVGFVANSFEHSGAFSRTSACPPRIMLLIPGNPSVRQTFDNAGKRTLDPNFFGFEADGRVRLRQVQKNGVDVFLERVGPIRAMSQPEFEAFMKRFHI